MAYSQLGGGRGARDEKGYIYIIRDGNKHRYKVGATNNPKRRLSELKRELNNTRLSVKSSKKVRSMKAAENEAHQYLKQNKKIKQEGTSEWFQGNYQTIQGIVKRACKKFPA